MISRRQCVVLVARQLAIYNGQKFETLDLKNRNALLALSQSVLATVERAQASCEWSKPGSVSND